MSHHGLYKQVINNALTNPMRMSCEFVDRFYHHGLARSNEYLSSLQTDMEKGKYPLFKDTIDRILSYGVTIEQEVFLY